MAKVSKKGQIYFPVKWNDALGGINEGDILYLHIEESRRVVWIDKTKNHEKAFTAPMLSENQLTIPVEVRELFEIQSGDTLDFGYSEDRKYVYFKKHLDTRSCPVCAGTGSIEDYKCFVCRESGEVEVEKFQHQFMRLTSVSRKYQVAVQYTWDEFNPITNEIIPLMYQRIKLLSAHYPPHLLERMQDYYQMKIIEEFSPHSYSNAGLFQMPSDALLKEILSFLITEDAKKEVTEWFRGERTVFGSS